MALDPATIDYLFTRIATRYGSGWMAKFDGIDERALRADWAAELGGLARHQLEFGLVNLPLDFPPDAGRFRALCREAPVLPPTKAELASRLPAPKPDPERWRETFKPLAAAWKAQSPTAWIDRLEARQRAGETLNLSQLEAMREARINLGSRQIGELTVTPEDSRRTDELKRQAAARVAQYIAETPELDPARA